VGPIRVSDQQQSSGFGRLAGAAAEHARHKPLAALLPHDDEVVLTAFAAEGQREQGLAGRSLRRAALILRGEIPPARAVEGGVGGVTLADELVELEREQATTLTVAGTGASQKRVPQRASARREIGAGQRCKLISRIVQPNRRPAGESTLIVMTQPERLLNPDRQIIASQSVPG
jgi:hypothetical protein